MNQTLHTLQNYFFHNELCIDKTTFLTIIIGQIAVYGILLTFYQFVASYQRNEKNTYRYLGTNIIDFYIRKNTGFFGKIVTKRIFALLLAAEILYKPLIDIYGHILSTEAVSAMNFCWFGFVIAYFLVFACIFFRCAQNIMLMKYCFEKRTTDYYINCINTFFLKHTLKKHVNRDSIKLLCSAFRIVRESIQKNENKDFIAYYNRLIIDMFDEYISRKKFEIDIIEKRGKILKYQVPWQYNINCEKMLLNDIIEGKYFEIDCNNIMYVMNFCVAIIELNIKRAKLAGYDKIVFNVYNKSRVSFETKELNLYEWEEILSKLYKNMDADNKQSIVKILYNNSVSYFQELPSEFCNLCLKNMIRAELYNVFCEKITQIEYAKIFNYVIGERLFNDYLAFLICDNLENYKKIDILNIIELLDDKNSMLVFTYVVLYFSIYKSRFSWEYINVKLLNRLWERHVYEADYDDYIISRIEESRISHRFNIEIFLKFKEYINAVYSGKLFRDIYNEKIIDIFYIWVIKVSIINKDTVGYAYQSDFDEVIQTLIINNLVKHEELLELEGIINWVNYARYNTFINQRDIPKSLEISLKSLLLTNINPETVISYNEESMCIYSNEVGKYLLIKLGEISKLLKKCKQVNRIIKDAFVKSNMSVEEYVTMLSNECDLCKYEINYVQKEKMKRYLIKVL